MKLTAQDILNALIAYSDDKIWASELAFNGGERRIDFWTLEPHRSKHFRSSAYEIKVSRADFKRDTAEKQQHALSFTDRFWYVTPHGLLDRSEIPEWAGLQEWDGRFFHVRKKAPMREKVDPTWEFIVSLIRNSGETRRDIGLMKQENMFLKMRNDRLEQQATIRNDRCMNRFLQSATKRQIVRPVLDDAGRAALAQGGGNE